MTSSGSAPEPGWYFDPDGGETERFWNGSTWTEFRRSRRSAEGQVSKSTIDPAASDEASSVSSGQHSGSGRAAGEARRAGEEETLSGVPAVNVGVARDEGRTELLPIVEPTEPGEPTGPGWYADPDGRGERFWDGKGWTADWLTAESPNPSANDSEPDENDALDPELAGTSTELAVGGLAQVQATGNLYHGRIGRVAKLSPPTVELDIRELFGTFSFPRGDVVALPNDEQTALADESAKKRFALVCVLVLAVVGVAIAVVVSAGHNASTTQQTPAKQQPPAGTSGPSLSAGTITGTRDDWVDAVCKLGTTAYGVGGFLDATTTAACIPRLGYGNILIGVFNSDYAMRSDLVQAGLYYYASASLADGSFIAIAANSGALQPLINYGFTINKVADLKR